MKKILAFLVCLLSQTFVSPAQNPALLDAWIPDQKINYARWKAQWITSPDAGEGYEVIMFRRKLSMAEVPAGFVVNVSADCRYKLYVNGLFVCDGPAKGDAMNWSFETVDIAPWLRTGDNVVAALVWNQGRFKPVAQMSMGRTAFLLQGDGEAESVLNTGGEWKSLLCRAYSPVVPKVRGYYASGSTDKLDASGYPWGWLEPGFDDSSWLPAKKVALPAVKGAGDYPNWQLVPRPIPAMERISLDFGAELSGVTIPAGTCKEFLMDGGTLTTGYPCMEFSGGKGAEIKISYAEALYENGPESAGPAKYAKGNRNITDGKYWAGYEDVILPDGGPGRMFEPLWWRTWRYVKVSVRTGDEPLSIDSFTAESSMYPFELASTFHSPDSPELEEILRIGWRTARLCAHETYMDCPYFEQLQYFGDARIQALVTIFNTRDTALPRRLLDLGKMSMTADGFTASRYPANVIQLISPYSLTWIDSCHDWWMYKGDEGFLRTLLPAMRTVLTTFASYLDDSGSLCKVPFWNFADWADLNNGIFPIDSLGHSAYMDLMFLISLRYAAEMEEAFGLKSVADVYREHSERLAKAVRSNYWSEERGLFADNGEMSDYSQHANVLAVIAGLVRGKDADVLFRKVVSDETLRPCTIYFNYYLQEAMSLSGNAGMLLDRLDVLRNQMALGLTTWAEMPEPSRSDCHAWGSSPNIEFYRMVLGIDSSAPGFSKVRIQPSLGSLREVSGSMPHPKGEISASYKLEGRMLKAEISIPEGVEGVFVWSGRKKVLRPGLNVITMTGQ